ncbi:MAG: 16S rRNA (guanine(527)-N(7))-methyltransferase RsmG [Firmicutes bacterium]|nr:16S rRNA (guanine(527)-N(7))-methyltransferase RsmG [Bacillota bacterium]
MNRNLISTLQKCEQEIGYNFNKEQLNQFNLYYNILIDSNKNVNLTSITDPEEVAVKHFIDSITCLKLINAEQSKKIIDVGTGAGFPGIVFKIVTENDDSMILLDSLQKRVDFLNTVIKELKLKNITAIHGRAEEIARETTHRESYDLVVSRAVANLSVLCEYCLPFLKTGGMFIAMKGPKGKQEIDEAQKAINTLGGELIDIKEINLPISNESRNLILINKVSTTPDKYPRRPGIPNKKPIK